MVIVPLLLNIIKSSGNPYQIPLNHHNIPLNHYKIIQELPTDHEKSRARCQASSNGSPVWPWWSLLFSWICNRYVCMQRLYIYMIYDIWYMIYDIWYMIYDIWYMTYDIWHIHIHIHVIYVSWDWHFLIFSRLKCLFRTTFQSVYSKCQRLEVSGESTPEIFRVFAAVCRRHGSFDVPSFVSYLKWPQGICRRGQGRCSLGIFWPQVFRYNWAVFNNHVFWCFLMIAGGYTTQHVILNIYIYMIYIYIYIYIYI